MSSKGSKEDIKTFDKLKQFFRLQKSNPGAYKHREDYVLTPELEKELCSECPVSSRVKALRELSETVLKCRLEEDAVGRLWCLLEDLLSSGVSKEHRHSVFAFYRHLIHGQWDKLGIMRAHIFKTIKDHDLAEDLGQRLELLQCLTDNGKVVTYFEDEIGPFLSDLMGPCILAEKQIDLLGILINVIKYHASYIDEDIMATIVKSTCVLCLKSTDERIVLQCLHVFDAVVCYSELPVESLPTFISTLCRAVNLEIYCPPSWKIMKNLLGTHLGYSSLCTMMAILRSNTSLKDPGLLRGAVFYINMALWSSSKIEKLKITPMAVLPSFIYAMKCRHNLVMYEVVLGVQRLINSSGSKLLNPSWSLILQIISSVLNHVDKSDRCDALNTLSRQVHEMLTSIEELIESDQFNGSEDAVFSIIAAYSKQRPESSIARLIKHYSIKISPIYDDWLTKLNELLARFYNRESRSFVRLRVLSLLSETVTSYRYNFGKPLVKIVVDHLADAPNETDMSVRVTATKLLVDVFLHSEPNQVTVVAAILKRILNRASDQKVKLREEDAEDIKIAAHGLIQVFTCTMYHSNPSSAIEAFLMMTSHLDNHYEQPEYMKQVSSVRHMILECLVHLRADANYRVGILGHEPVYSSFLMAHPLQESSVKVMKALQQPAQPVVKNPLMPEFHVSQTPVEASSEAVPADALPDSWPCLPIACITQSIVKALRTETDWKVMVMLLGELPLMLQNRALFVSEIEMLGQKKNTEIDYVATTICAMIFDRNTDLPDKLVNTPPKFMRSDFQGYIFPVLAAFIPYQVHLDVSLQKRIIKCLECVGLQSKKSNLCVNALTICTLEMREAMIRLLPEVLLNLSKISATKYIAIPILEFLSTLTQLPDLFTNFVQDQYMSVFAISLPYTNPFKYHHYTVSLAHHVIASWFLKCRLPFRKDFVKFITRGLKSNILVPFEEGRMMVREEIVNEDSSNRKRSSSLTEQGNRRKHQSNISRPAPPPINTIQMSFHKELTETCIDLMAMYTYSTCSPVPKRRSTADLVLNGGRSMTWLLGHKLITVTTSGCNLKALKQGLCDRCHKICHVEPRHQLSKDSSDDRKSGKTENKSSESNPSTNSTGPNTPDEEKTVFPEPEQAKIDQLIYGKSQEIQVCACWCKGWAEILVQRPTGSMSWAMRLQNEPHSLHWKNWKEKENSSSDISTLFIPAKNEEIYVTKDPDLRQERVGSDPVSIPQSPVRNVYSDIDDLDLLPDEEGTGRNRNPVRRSNSSPEMSSSWKNPLLNSMDSLEAELGGDSTKKKQNYSKDMRANCEAIPEEVGTTPPSDAVLLQPQAVELEPARSQDYLAAPPEPPKEADSRGPADPASLPPLAFKRDRGHTISVMSPARKPGGGRGDWDHLAGAKSQGSSSSTVSSTSSSKKEAPRPTAGVNPSFVFLQLYHSACFGCPHEKPILLNSNNHANAIRNLNWIPPYEAHRIGVLYVGPGQVGSEVDILRNEYGSPRYSQFLQRLGTLINLAEADRQQVFLGGLQTNGEDGKFSYMWQDDIMQVIFHVATLMPNHPNDPKGNKKKLHIGNNFATIVYNDSGEEFNFQIIKGQFNFAVVVVEPLEHGTNQIKVQVKDDLNNLISHTDYKVISDHSVSILARQLALHCNLAATVVSKSKQEPYASNWLERLRQIKRIQSKTVEERPQARNYHHSGLEYVNNMNSNIQDFTEYT